MPISFWYPTVFEARRVISHYFYSSLLMHATHKKGEMTGGVVGTLMSNLGLELGLKQMDIPFVRAKVGDRYVVEAT
ncbi:phosphoglucomutase/phosphomannomutase-like protein [Shewanella putrefaciens]|nr:phosphoglucomutase/phosphomannomutase-like protein [Shewanella putrefaciens]